jgi:uncharacterized protein YuzE
MFKPLEIVGDTAVRTTDQKVRDSNPFERAEFSSINEAAANSQMEKTVTDYVMTLDSASNAAYITFNDGAVVKTVDASDYANVDLDTNGKIVGIEFLTLDVPDDLVDSLILFDELKDESELINKLIETSRAAAGH